LAAICDAANAVSMVQPTKDRLRDNVSEPLDGACAGGAKAIWVIALIIFPLLAVLAYLITQSRGMAERNTQQAQQARDKLRRVVGFSASDEIEKLDRLKKTGSITRRIRASSCQARSIVDTR
jgi:hypothetical protein